MVSPPVRLRKYNAIWPLDEVIIQPDCLARTVQPLLSTHTIRYGFSYATKSICHTRCNTRCNINIGIQRLRSRESIRTTTTTIPYVCTDRGGRNLCVTTCGVRQHERVLLLTQQEQPREPHWQQRRHERSRRDVMMSKGHLPCDT